MLTRPTAGEASSPDFYRDVSLDASVATLLQHDCDIDAIQKLLYYIDKRERNRL